MDWEAIGKRLGIGVLAYLALLPKFAVVLFTSALPKLFTNWPALLAIDFVSLLLALSIALALAHAYISRFHSTSKWMFRVLKAAMTLSTIGSFVVFVANLDSITNSAVQ